MTPKKRPSKKRSKKNPNKRKRTISFVLLAFFLFIAGGLYYVNTNLNKLISSKIYSLYNQSEAVNYYNLHFDKLRVNLLSMNIHVYGVHFEPKVNEHKDFFAENGSMEVSIGKILIDDASIIEFLSSNNISIKEFVVKDSKIKIRKTAAKFQPFAFIVKTEQPDSLKIHISIQKINITKAELLYFRHEAKNTENSFDDFNMEITKLELNKEQSFNFSLDELNASLNDISYRGKNGTYVSMQQFQMGVKKFTSQKANDAFSFDYKDFFFHISKPQFVTADSVYTISATELNINKSTRQLLISNAILHPNLSRKEFTKNYKYQKLRPELNIEHIKMTNIHFDRLVDMGEVFTDSLIISGVVADLYKSKKAPLNKRKIPHYLALQIKSIKQPMHINVVEASDVEINFTLQQEDGRLSKIAINKINGQLHNVQNRNSSQKLLLNAKGQIENSLPFAVKLQFDYHRDLFTYSGKVYKSNLKRISTMIRTFAPIEISSGELKSIVFKGVANRTDSRGAMTFLYNNLNIQLHNKEPEHKAKFGNQILSFAANTYLLSNNPANPSLPARNVQFVVGRNMNKGFIHILVQSLLNGMKETVIPSRENRKRYKKMKKHDR
ncbi:MAG: hypothetical protein KAG64_01575 [Bacteroidales bacterium]|nr:hypothetical protein [Bacteroidales bacterium]